MIEAGVVKDSMFAPVRIDGRRLRSERTKQLIIEAYLALAREESPVLPTAAKVAERAGYSVRSVFERFPDLHGLQIAAADFAITQVVAMAAPRDVGGDRMTRIRSHVGTRARASERWLPLWRALIANQSGSEELQARTRAMRERVLSLMEHMYAPELSSLSDTARKHTLVALEAIVDVESWARMREHFGLSDDEVSAAWIQAIDRLLPPTPSE
ncbi:MAG: TetR/AcrR family transcriptional regulator [Reyranella sp.]|uniref:TetR/AcrR family transcriptional regulator n=1 Tax=Reyranella sp. TaxID=1929291 RepID=UPI002731195C|nr:TetR/AcrR family transcriptional regulator [Reyranella sp.]MDP1966132.1 TetR/AcrR family transcriptional regulator [Reyranella sp.]MDP2373106.1 TetR/AcrR family transcriptional regulator [Reyranella sp.]